MSDSNDMLAHFLRRLHADITRIEDLIHVVHQDVHFLLEAGQLDRDDAQLILSKVPAIIASQSPAASAGAPGRHHPGQHGHGNPNNNSHGSRSRVSLDITTDPDAVAPPSYPSLENVMNNVPVARGLPPAPKRQARALWDYNLNNEEPEDLAFDKGAIIEVIKENNEDWWTGKCNGRSGIFPSNYVEILHHPLPTWSTIPPATATKARPPPESAPKYMPSNPPKPAQQPPQQQQQQQQQPHQQEEDDLKKPKYANLKNTMAHSAANGLGFGAGAAIGGSVVRAIF
jgi:hypothetical protein